MRCDTVKIAAPVSAENPLGYVVINADDLAEGQTLFVAAAEPKPSRRAAKKE